MAKETYVARSHVEELRNVALRPTLRSFADAVDEILENVDGLLSARTVSASEKFKGLNSNDFALCNILAAGAVDQLKECSYAPDIDVQIAHAAASLSEIENNISNSEE